MLNEIYHKNVFLLCMSAKYQRFLVQVLSWLSLHGCKRKRCSHCGFGWGGGRVLGFLLPPSACRTDQQKREVHAVIFEVLCIRCHVAVVVSYSFFLICCLLALIQSQTNVLSVEFNDRTTKINKELEGKGYNALPVLFELPVNWAAC